LADLEELVGFETNPVQADTDKDGLEDGTEVSVYGSDPRDIDTDGDRYADGLEVKQFGTDPTVKDSDADGLTEREEIAVYNTDPTTADTDSDGLSDGREVNEVHTDPLDPDTDGDGLPDGAEAADAGPVSAGDPLRTDVFVEIDYMSGHRPSTKSLAVVRQAYRNATVSNPDGSEGISLHIAIDGPVAHDRVTSNDDLRSYHRSSFNRSGQGYHYAVAVHDAGEDTSGFAVGTGRFVFQTERRQGYLAGHRYDARHLAGIFMHELGHSLGLRPGDFEGIDSRDVPYSEYRSIMNYNAPRDAVRYSAGEPFDDWAHLEDELATPNATALGPDTEGGTEPS
jgi:hypothetical protein